jgi:uncharacterized protein YndB with AHSA1/START domain
MTEQATTEAVRHSVTVPIDRDSAFRLFTEGIGSWWPSDTHKISEGPVTEVFETRLGGRWYEVTEDGSECTVGTILEWDAPNHFVMAWQLTPDWAPEPDLDRATKVEVRFEDDEDGGTRVALEHRGFEAYGESGARMRGEVDSGDGGWPALMQLYAENAGG